MQKQARLLSKTRSFRAPVGTHKRRMVCLKKAEATTKPLNLATKMSGVYRYANIQSTIYMCLRGTVSATHPAASTQDLQDQLVLHSYVLSTKLIRSLGHPVFGGAKQIIFSSVMFRYSLDQLDSHESNARANTRSLL